MPKHPSQFHALFLVWILIPADCKAQPTTDHEFETLWAGLLTNDPVTAERLIADLVAEPRLSVAFLQKRLHAVPRLDSEFVAQCVTNLDNDQYRVRDTATLRLRQMGERIEPALRKALDKERSAEARHRILNILYELKQVRLYPPLDRRRQMMAIEVLERIGDDAARQLLITLAIGDPNDSLTMDARGALDRVTGLSERTVAK
jgi:HEAT repeat protein